MLRTPITFLLCLCVLPAFVFAEAEEPSYPKGRSTQKIEGLTVELGIPEGLTAEKPGSLIVILHGAGGSAAGMAASMREWIPLGYVVCAPQASGQVWSDSDVKRVKTIAQHLMKALPIDKTKVHVVGYSNGGWNLPPLAFDDDLKPRTATWVASGFRGAKPPKWAASMGVLALAGTRDANAASARETVKLLRKNVDVVEARFQPNLDHAWPGELMPYFRWWMGAREGRCTPGVDMNFTWYDDLDIALKKASVKKKGGVMLYAYDSDVGDLEATRLLQTDVFMDPLVRFFAEQLLPTKLDAKEHGERLAGFGVTSYPAIVLLDKTGKPKKVFEGKTLKQRKILAGLRSLAPDRKKPKDL